MTDKEKGLIEIQKLVARFEQQLPAYKKSDYNETQTRTDFIGPFFEALGWDVNNKKDYSESHRGVIHEAKIKIGNTKKTPDYLFRLSSSEPLFFVEAKKPSIFIKEDIIPAFQLRNYAWNSQLSISILTDFEEFSVYDCTKKPLVTDKASVARIEYLTYKDYVNKWDFLWDTFSNEGVLKGGFDKYNLSNVNKKGTSTVDKEFLKSLDEWRTVLAENINKDNKSLNEDELNFIVQHTLDRIIFLRICEDRAIEPNFKLSNCLVGNDFYQNLFKEFKEAEEKYNSGLFDFKKDTLSQKIIINNKIINKIINDFYLPDCPYDFSVLSVEILGSAYEQFLGKTITINERGKAVVDFKPEVRKAGGVYYTPKYIVDYIIENTVGELCKNKTPKQIEKIKIVDPACGSGSFLLGAYQFLLTWHKDYYNQYPNKKNPLTPDKNLTTEEKKRILLNNIFGVDIDINAVEVTKLSLLLKCLEGETNASISHQMTMFRQRVLPSLEFNIQIGNSLIDLDIYSNELDFGEERKIKPFSWKKAFPEVFEQGGFDVVVGNPPYVKEYTHREIFVYIKKSHLAKYYQGKMDLWYFFVCHGIDILNTNGKLGVIVPNNWVTNAGASILRNKVITESSISNIVDFGSYMVFENASIQTMVLLLDKIIKNNYTFDYRKNELEKPSFEIINNLLKRKKNEGLKYIKPTIKHENFKDNFLVFSDRVNFKLLDKIKSKQNFILDDKEVANGIHSHYDFITKSINNEHKNQFKIGEGIFGIHSDELKKLKLTSKELKLIKPYYNNSELIGRYYFNEKNNKWIIYTTSNFKNKKSMNDYPNLKAHLDKYKKVITSDNAPYGLHRAREEYFFKDKKIIALRKCLSPTFSYVEFDSYVSATFYLIKTDRINLKYLTGLLNSKLIAYWLHKKGKMQGNNYQIDKGPLLDIPIFNPIESQTDAHDQIVKSVDQLLQLNRDLQEATLQTGKDQIQNKIDYHEDKINNLVYQLYDLTEEEINLIK